jgi:hypothetical protein
MFLPPNWWFRWNRRLTPMSFERIFQFFETCKNSYKGPLCITDREYGGHSQEIWSFGQFFSKQVKIYFFFKIHKHSYMAVMAMKYRVSVSFCRQTGDFGKIVGWHLWILIKNLIFSKTNKKSYTWPLYITDPWYRGLDQEIRSVGQFMPQTSDFR